jgi:hypothetical protein
VPEFPDQPVSHVDLYHKLGRLEAMTENVMGAVSSFQVAVRDLHARLDTLEEKQRAMESATISSLFRDFAIPVVAIGLTWYIATADKKAPEPNKSSYPQPLAIIRADRPAK